MTENIVNWYGEQVRLVAHNATMSGLRAIAFRILEHAGVNIENNGQVDTGFMVNSGYVVTPDDSSYSEARTAAKQQNPNAEMGPEVTLPNDETIAVAYGAEYSVFQEIQNSFLLLGVEQTAGEEAGREIEIAGREHGL